MKSSIICDSILGGMFLSNTVTILDYESIIIQKNAEYALHIPEQSMKKLVFFYIKSKHGGATPENTKLFDMFARKTQHLHVVKESHWQGYNTHKEANLFTTDEEFDKVERIQGKIGGPWGKLSPKLP